jgi:hypothetical protein
MNDAGMISIFISYRRGISSGWTGHLAEKLREHLDSSNIFMDIESLQPGTDFVEAISNAMKSCDVLLVIIAPDWLTAKTQAGQRRIDDPGDFVRIEIASALSRNIRVIPVLVGGAIMPTAEDLPEELQALSRRQAHELSDTRWDFDCLRLIGVLKGISINGPMVRESASISSTVRASEGKQPRLTLALISGAVIGIILIGGYFVWWIIGYPTILPWNSLSSLASNIQIAPQNTQKNSPAFELGTGTQSSLNALSTYLDIDELQVIFPDTPKNQIQENYPFLIKALAKFSLADKTMLAMALAIISAENVNLVPTEEQKSRFNTSPGGQAFDLYDYRKDLGNQGPNDGSLFKGRGYLRLTGRKNYEDISNVLGYGKLLLEQPDKALDPTISSEVLVFFLHRSEAKIREAADRNSIEELRRLPNGGSHGIERFRETYKRVIALINDKGL